MGQRELMPGRSPLRVVSWNLGAAWGDYVERHEAAWRWLEALDPDLGLLQEAVPPAWARERWTVLQLPFQHWASAVVARRTSVIEGIEPVAGSLLARVGNYLATAELTLADGNRLLVASVHARAKEAPAWLTSGADRSAIARRTVGEPWWNDVIFHGYAEMTAGRRFIVGGDWNTARMAEPNGDWQIQGGEFFTRAARHGWIDTSVDDAGNEARTWFAGNPARPYQPDHVFADQTTATTLRSFTVDPRPASPLRLSDHAPIVLEFELEPAKVSAR